MSDSSECYALMKASSDKRKGRAAEITKEMFTKNNIPWKLSKQENVLIIKYLGANYYVSAVNFLFRKEGSSIWFRVYKRMLKLSSKFRRGKYYGVKVKDVIYSDMDYVVWYIDNVTCVVSNEVYDILKDHYSWD